MKNILKSLIFVFIILLVNPLYAQFQNKRKAITQFKGSYIVSSSAIPSGYVNITKYLPKNYVKNGTVDYTIQIQKALNENRNVIMPNFPIMIKGLNVKSNSKIWFQPSSKLLLKPNNETHYMILALIGVENVSIYNANLEGDYSKHLGTAGAWGYGIDIRGSRNIKIENSIISNCWGDGICISSNHNKFTKNLNLFNTNNIIIKNSIIDYNRRNGITIAGGENISITNSLISNTFGVQPKSGIDFEPDNSKPKMENITLNNVKFYNNAFGLNFFLNSYADNKINKNIQVKINNLVFEDQITALVIYGYDKKIKKMPLKGLVEIDGVKLINVNNPIFRGPEDHRIIPDFSIRNWNNSSKKMDKNNILKGVKSQIGLDVK